ncbi:MAG TPA: hypothetical protein VFS67_04840 [Polyangiaceae bacterium]|nr:hypothetical protein [Polyangiaceae bacterium]
MADRERAALGSPVQARGRRAPGVAAIAGLIGLAAACLNPHPDDEPTFVGADVPPATDVAPREESCADNPLLAGCQGQSAGSPAGPAGAGGSASTAADAGAPSGGSAGAADAGCAAGAADAAERDAGPVDATAGASDAG